MAISRRELLGRGGLLAALAAMPTSIFAAGETKTVVASSSSLYTKERFESLKGSVFQVTSANMKQAMTLVEVKDAPESEAVNTASFSVPAPKGAPAPTTTEFIVRFYGGTHQLAQGTYTFENEKTGAFSLFIVPSIKDKFFYTAVFNRIW
jgi:hypothetical protein